MELVLSNCILRRFTLNDVPSIARNANNPNIACFVRDIFPFPYTESDAQFFIENIASDPRNLILAIVVDHIAVGSIGVHPQQDVYRKNAEIGYWLGENYWGRGIASEAIKAITKHAFEFYHLHRVFANVFENNIASVKALEKAGFTKEAVHRKAIIKNGVIMDELVLAKLLL